MGCVWWVVDITLRDTVDPARIENRLFSLHGLFEAVSGEYKVHKWLEEKQFTGGSRSDYIGRSL